MYIKNTEYMMTQTKIQKVRLITANHCFFRYKTGIEKIEAAYNTLMKGKIFSCNSEHML